jgi:hypothetical protein
MVSLVDIFQVNLIYEDLPDTIKQRTKKIQKGREEQQSFSILG